MKHIKFLFALVIAAMTGASAWAATGDTFTVLSIENVEVTYSVMHEVGDDQPATARVGTTTSNQAINTGTSGTITIPSTVSREVNGETYTYTVISISNQAFAGCGSITEINLPSTLTDIQAYAFQRCTSLVTINIPAEAQIPQIYSRTFYNCSSLKNITLPSSITYIDIEAFYGCSSLESFSVPSSVTAIYGSAFRGCSSLTSIDIPASVTTISNKDKNGSNNYGSPFQGCTLLSRVNIEDIAAWNNITFATSSLNPLQPCFENGSGETALYMNGQPITDLVIPEGVTTVKSGPFLYNKAIQTVTIPSTVTTIQNNSFKYTNNNQNVGCPNLRKVIMKAKALIERNNSSYKMSSFFGSDITEFVIDCEPACIGYYTFQQMSNLTTVVIPSSVTEIQNYAFDRTGLTSLTLPSGLVTIGEYAFYNCTNLTLTSDVFPNSLLTIGKYAFYNCDGLTSVEFQTGLRSIGQYAFDDCGLTSITLPTPRANNSYDMKSLNTAVFSGCIALTSITIPEGFTAIGESAFNNCWGLEEVNLPSTLTSIGLYAFQDCRVLPSITIPSKVSTISKNAFANCFILNEVTIQRETPPSQTTPVFRTPAEGETVTLKVPMGCESSYATNYGQYFTNIVGIPMPGQVIQIDGINYTILTSPDGETPGTVMLGKGSYSQPAYGSSASGEITIPGSVSYTSGEGEEAINYNFTVTTLGAYSFYNCYNVTRINLPATITEIQNYAVSGCGALERLYLASSTPNTYIAEYAFQDANTGNCILVVPQGSKTGYQNSVWGSIFPYIKEVEHETEWLPGDIFWTYVYFGEDCEKYVPFKILTVANGDTPGAVQMGSRDYDNTEPLGEMEQNPSIFEKGDFCPSEVTIPSSVEFNNSTYSVTTLGAYVLSEFGQDYDGESKLVLPSTITTIGYKAFNYGCWVENLYVNSTTVPSLIIGDDSDDEYPAPFGWQFNYDEGGCNLFVPEGYVQAYSSWAPYFKSIMETPKPVVICGVEYKRETDIFGDGTAVIRWEFEESGVIKKSNTKGSSDEDEYAEYLYQYGVPVLTLNNATINYTDNGPAIEVNSFSKFYIRVKGINTITASNAAAAISVGTNKGVDMSQTSLIFLSDDVPTNQGGVIVDPIAYSWGNMKGGTGSSANQLPSLTITNGNTTDGDGVYVYQGSFNVQDCDVTVTGKKYGLEFGAAPLSSVGYEEKSTKAKRRKAVDEPTRVVPVNGPVDAEEYPGWMNVYEGSALTLNGGTAALWGAIGYYNNYDYSYYPGYLQNVYLQETDKSTYDANYTTVEGPNYYPYDPESEYEDERGTYTFWMTNAEDPGETDWFMAYAKNLKFGCDYFIATTDEGVRMKFKPLEGNTCQVGDFNEQAGPITAIDKETEGSVTIPSEANGYQVTSICEGAFYECEDITAISIPATVNNIGVMAFGDCECLSTITCYATNPPTLETQTNEGNTYTPFSFAGGKDGMILYVPAGSVDAYGNAGWGEYFTQILPIGGAGYVFTAKTQEDVMLTFMVLGTEENQTYVQVGTGNNQSVVSTPKNWDGSLTIPYTVSDAGGNEYKVAGVADYAFYYFSDLYSLTISEGVGYIGSDQANWNGSFQDCSKLTTVTLPNSIYSISNYAFNYCGSLSEVYLYAAEVPTLGQNYAFYNGPILYVLDEKVQAYQTAWGGESGYFSMILGMSQKPFVAETLEGVKLTFLITGDYTVQVGKGDGNSVVSTPEKWDGTLTVPSTVQDDSGKSYNVKTIADKALYQWSDLQSVTISEGIEYIGSGLAGWGAFEGDYNLTTVSLPSTTKSLANWCFSNCENITDVYLYADDVPSLNGNTFSSSYAILHVPAGTKAAYVASSWAQYFGYGDRIVEMEGNSPFFTEEVNGVEMTFKQLTINEETHKGTVCVYGYVDYSVEQPTAIPAIASSYEGALAIPETVKHEVDDEEIEYTIVSLSSYAFAQCVGLTSVSVPNTVTSVGEGAFCYCPSLKTVTLGSNVQTIDGGAFYDCNSIESMTSNATDVPALNSGEAPHPFGTFTSLETKPTLYVPVGCAAAYQAAGWTTDYFAAIVEMGGELEPGDVSGDGAINVTDVTALVSIILGNASSFTPAQLKAADLNNDGVVNVSDVTALVSIILNQ